MNSIIQKLFKLPIILKKQDQKTKEIEENIKNLKTLDGEGKWLLRIHDRGLADCYDKCDEKGDG